MKIATVALFLCVVRFAEAQQNFIPATITLTNGDSLKGTVDYRDWKKTPDRITFKDNNGTAKTFEAGTIASFYVASADETFISKAVVLDMTPDDPDNVLASTIISPVVIEKTIFLLQLLKSPSISLYEHVDENQKVHFFYIKDREQPTELIHRKLYSESLQKILDDTRYKQQLADLTASCPAVSKKAAGLKYNQQQVMQFIAGYINCINPSSSVVVRQADKVAVKFGVLAGVMFNSYKFVGDIDIASDNYSNYTSPVAGVVLDAALSRRYDKLHIINELIYKRNKTSAAVTSTTTTGFQYERGLAFDFSYVQLNTVFRYNFGLSPVLKPFMDAGIGNAVIVNEKTNTMYTKYSTGAATQFGKGIDGVRKYEFSALAGAGVQVRNMSLELRYGFAPKSFSPYQNLDVRTSSAQIIAVYNF